MGKEADQFFAALLSEGDTGKYIRMGDISAVFSYVPSELEYFDFIRQFMVKYGKLPDLKTFNEATGKDLKKSTEDAQYYYDHLVERHIKKTLIASSREASGHLKEGEVVQAFEIIRTAVEGLSLQRAAPLITDFKDSHDLLKSELRLKKEEGYGVNTGWEYFDNMNGSTRPGDLISLVGRTGLGKTWLLLYVSMNAWRVHKKPVLFFSMEMAPVLIMERLSSMMQSVPYNRVKLGEFPKGLRGVDKKKEFLEGMLELKNSDMPPFNVIGGNLTTNIDEIVALARQLKPAAVFVDGAYLVKTNQRFQKHERIGYVANSLKADVGGTLGIPVFATWQFNKEVTKLKKGQRVGTEHIGGADEIGNVSSIVMGLFEEESASTIRQRRVEIVKGRGGEAGEFYINWDFQNMNFDQIEEIQDYKIMVT